MAWQQERGIAIIVAILALTLVSALVTALTVMTSSEVLIAGNFRDAQQTFYAADAAAQWAMADLAAVSEQWEEIAAGARQSTFVDGPAGRRVLPNGETLDLGVVLLNNPGWQLYGHGLLNDLLPASEVAPPHYVVVFVAADPATADRLKIRAVSCGPRGGRRAVEVALRRGPAGVRPALP